jgi:FtsH-binding integral membrane protein
VWDWVAGLSTALSAPLWVLLAFVATLVVARRRPASRGAAGAVIAMGAAFVAGMLVEPITYRVLSPGGFDPIPAAFVVLNLALPVLIVIFAAQELPARPGTKRASAS